MNAYILIYGLILLVVTKKVVLYTLDDIRDKKNTTVEIGVFLSNGIEGNCIKAAALMATNRIERDGLLSVNNIQYHVLPKFQYLTADEHESIIEINSFVDDLPIRQAPSYYLGSPRRDQNEWISKIAMGRSGLALIPVITYSGKRESLQFSDYSVEVSPTIYHMLQGSVELIRHFNWSKTAIIYDASFNEYKETNGYLYSLLENANITILSKAVFFSKQEIDLEMTQLEDSNSRVIFGMFSAKAARKVFCEAFKRHMYRPVVVWILFEHLPNGWAGSEFDPVKGREISCTEDELLYASSGYIFFEKSSMLHNRNDNVLEEFNEHLRNLTNDESVDAAKSCSPNILYAYDAIILSAALYGEFLKDPIIEVYASLIKHIQITRIAVQGLTGRIQFFKLVEWDIFARSSGLINIFHTTENSKKELIGTFSFDEDKEERTFSLADNASHILFSDDDNNGEVPSDSGFVEIVYKSFGNSTLWVMWGLALAGVVFVLVLFYIDIVYTWNLDYDKSNLITDQIIYIGAILCYASVIIYGLDPRFLEVADMEITCTVFTIALTFGVTLFLGPILIRTWEMYKLSLQNKEENDEEDEESTQVQKVKISVLKLFLIFEISQDWDFL